MSSKEEEKEKIADLMGYGPEYQNSLVAILSNQKAKDQMKNKSSKSNKTFNFCLPDILADKMAKQLIQI